MRLLAVWCVCVQRLIAACCFFCCCFCCCRLLVALLRVVLSRDFPLCSCANLGSLSLVSALWLTQAHAHSMIDVCFLCHSTALTFAILRLPGSSSESDQFLIPNLLCCIGGCYDTVAVAPVGADLCMWLYPCRRLLGELGALEVLLWRVRRCASFSSMYAGGTGSTTSLDFDARRDSFGSLKTVLQKSEPECVQFLLVRLCALCLITAAYG